MGYASQPSDLKGVLVSEFLLVQIDDTGAASVVTLTDPVVVTQEVTIPLATLFPQTVPAPSEPAPAEEPTSSSDAQPPSAP